MRDLATSLLTEYMLVAMKLNMPFDITMCLDCKEYGATSIASTCVTRKCTPPQSKHHLSARFS